MGIAATCWLSDSRADCPLTVPSPEQKSRRGSPSCARTSCSRVSGRLWPFSKPLRPPVGRQGLKLSSRLPCPQLATEREWSSCWQRLALAAVATGSPAEGLASSPVVLLEGPSQPPVWRPRTREPAAVARAGRLPWWQWNFLIPPLACSRLSLRALPFLWCDRVGYLPTHLPLQVLMRHGRSPGALLGLTVTFLPELPARPPLQRWRFLRTFLALSALLPTHVLSRHKDQRSDGFSLSPAALGGGVG